MKDACIRFNYTMICVEYKRFFAIRWFGKNVQAIFSGQDYMDFALVDSVLHFNDGKRKHAGIFSQMGYWMLVSIPTFIFGQTTPARYVPALRRTMKEKNVNQSITNYKSITNWWRSLCWGWDCQLLINLTKLLFTSFLTFIYKMT